MEQVAAIMVAMGAAAAGMEALTALTVQVAEVEVTAAVLHLRRGAMGQRRRHHLLGGHPTAEDHRTEVVEPQKDHTHRHRVILHRPSTQEVLVLMQAQRAQRALGRDPMVVVAVVAAVVVAVVAVIVVECA